MDSVPHQGSYWSAEQCAAHRGISPAQWLVDVSVHREPPPTIRHPGADLWEPQIVRSWRHHGQLNADEWLAKKCAYELGMPVHRWMSLVRYKKAPQPARRIGNYRVWDAAEVRRYQPPPARPGHNAAPSQRTRKPYHGMWTSTRCAQHWDMSPLAWREAVLRGDAPPPVRVTTNKVRLWEPEVVQALDPHTLSVWRYPSTQQDSFTADR